MQRARTTSRRDTRRDPPSLDALISEATSLSERFGYRLVTTRCLKLYVQLMNDIDRGRKRYTRPSFADSEEQNEHHWADGVRDWFARANKMFSKDEYRKWVCYFGSKQLESLRERDGGLLFPPHRQDQRHYPYCLDEMPVLEDLTPHTGGRPPSSKIVARNELIRELKGKRASHRRICQELDQKKYRPPADWEVRSWKAGYEDAHLRSLIHKMFSVLKPFKDPLPGNKLLARFLSDVRHS